MPLSVVYINVDGQPMSEIRGGVVTEYVHDPLGNLIATNTSVGIVTWTGDYWPYGESMISSGTKANNWGFCAAWGYYDDGYDNSYVRRRVLRRKLARWQTVDPIWPAMDLYQYANGRPTFAIDPNGMKPCDPAVQNFLNQATKSLCDQWKNAGPMDFALLYMCALSRLDSGCRRFYQSNKNKLPKIDKLKSCMGSYCKLEPLGSFWSCGNCKGCATTECYPKFIGTAVNFKFTLCEDAYSCKGTSASIKKGCETGASAYGIGSYSPASYPPAFAIVFHELMHACATCTADEKNKTWDRCEEQFTQALTACAIAGFKEN